MCKEEKLRKFEQNWFKLGEKATKVRTVLSLSRKFCLDSARVYLLDFTKFCFHLHTFAYTVVLYNIYCWWLILLQVSVAKFR